MSEQTKTIEDLFTPESARTMSEAEFKRVQSSVATRISKKVDRDQSLMVAAAYATYAWKRITGTKAFKAKDYAATVGAPDSMHSSLNLWARLGVALVDGGVQKDTNTWTALAGRSAANSFPVAHVLDGQGLDGKGEKGSVAVTPEDLTKALGYLMNVDEKGEYTTKKKAEEARAAHAKDFPGAPLTDEEAAEQAKADQKVKDQRFTENLQFVANNWSEVSASVFEVPEVLAALKAILTTGQAKAEQVESDLAAKKAEAEADAKVQTKGRSRKAA